MAAMWEARKKMGLCKPFYSFIRGELSKKEKSMQIKVHAVSELFTIRDTTPGQITIWIMVIMLLAFYILYQLTCLFWAMKRVSQLKKWEEYIKKGRAEGGGI